MTRHDHGDGDHVLINILLDNHHHHHHHLHHLLPPPPHNNNNTINHNNVAHSDLPSPTERFLTPPSPSTHHSLKLKMNTSSNTNNGSITTHGCSTAPPACHGGDAAMKLSMDDGDGNGDGEFGREYGSRGSSMVDMMTKKRVMGECRICQEEDERTNLESPCACSGSLKFAHRKCVQHWCNEKGDTTCEICLQPYQGNYTAPTLTSTSGLNSFSINISEPWEIAGSQRIDMHEPRIFTVASEHLFSESDYEEYARANERSAACFRSVAFVLMVVLVLRHILAIVSSGGANNAGDQHEAPTFFLLFVLRAMGFFLPCYIMGRALNMIQWRRQRESLAASEVAYILQTGIQGRGVRIAMSRGVSP